MSRAAREGAARERAREGHERLGALLEEAHAATREAVQAWRCGAGLGALDRHIKGALADLRRVRARLVLDAEPADLSQREAARRGAAQRWASRLNAPAAEYE